MSQNKTAAAKAKRLLNQNQALQLRALGHTVRGIAAALRCGKSTAQRLLEDAFAAEREGISQAKADLVETEVMRCDMYLQALAPQVQRGNRQAIETALKVGKRRSELLGLDVPQKVEQASTGTMAVQLTDLDLSLFTVEELRILEAGLTRRVPALTMEST